MSANYFSQHSTVKSVDLLLKSLCQCPLFRVVKKYAFSMGGEEFYFQLFGNVLTFEEIFECWNSWSSVFFSAMSVLISSNDPSYLHFFQDQELQPRPSLKKIGFSGQILRKFKLWLNPFIESTVIKIWSHDRIYNLSHEIKWSHGQKSWRHNLYFKISLFKEACSTRFFCHYQNCNYVA